MKKLIYSTFVALFSSALLVSCGDSGSGDGDDPKPIAPSIEFQTNTGTFGGFTFTSGRAEIKTKLKFGVKINSTVENIKSTKMTYKYNNQTASIVGTDSIIVGNTKSVYREYTFDIPEDKGTYTFTFSATDKAATTSTADIVIVAYGLLAERLDGTFYSLKSATPGNNSAFDLLNGESVSAASGAGNEAFRDIVDASTGATLSGIWNSGNGATFVKSDANGKIANKVYTQFKSEEDLIAAFDAGVQTSTVSGLEIGSMVIVKSTRNGSTMYYLLGITDMNDESGSNNDSYTFQYKQ